MVDDPVPVLRDLTDWAVGDGHALSGLEVRRRSLEDVYLELTATAERASAESEAPVPTSRRRRRRR